MIDTLGTLLELVFTLWLVWFAGVLAAQVIKLLPLFLGLAGTLSFHSDFPMEAYRGLRTHLKMLPLEFFSWPFVYLGQEAKAGDFFGFLGGLIAFPVVYFALLIGIWHGFWYISIIRIPLSPVRVVYNVN